MKTQRIFPLDLNGDFKVPVIGCFVAIEKLALAIDDIEKCVSRPQWCHDEEMLAYGMIIGVSDESGAIVGGSFMTNSQLLEEGRIVYRRNMRLITVLTSAGKIARIIAKPGSSSLRFYSVKT